MDNGNFTAACWSSGVDLDPAQAPPGADSAYFMGGVDETTSASQSVDLSAGATEIDAGGVSATLSGYLGGNGGYEDNMVVIGVFESGTAQPLGVLTIGPVTAADRNNKSVLLQRSTTATVPVGTRSVLLTMTATKDSSSHYYNEAAADELSLTLTGANAPVDSSSPSVPGAQQQDITTTADPGTWANAPMSFAYQWLRCDDASIGTCTSIGGAASRSYMPTGPDIGKLLRVRVTASNADGESAPATSDPTQPVAAQPTPIVSGLRITQTGLSQVTLTGHLQPFGAQTEVVIVDPNGFYLGDAGSSATETDVSEVTISDGKSVAGTPDLVAGQTYRLGLKGWFYRYDTPGIGTQLSSNTEYASIRMSGTPALTAAAEGCASADLTGTIVPYGTPTTYHWMIGLAR